MEVARSRWAPDMGWETTGRKVRPPAANENPDVVWANLTTQLNNRDITVKECAGHNGLKSQ